MLAQCWPYCGGQGLQVVLVEGLQVCNQDAVTIAQQFITGLANVHANPGGFKRFSCVHKANAGPKAHLNDQ